MAYIKEEYPDDRLLKFLFWMVFVYPLLAAVVFPFAHMFIFRERALLVLSPFFYILLARLIGKFPVKILSPLIIFMICGSLATIHESLWTTDAKYRVLMDGRTLARKIVRQMGPHDFLRGNNTLDGIAMFEYQTKVKSSKYPVARLYFISENAAEAKAFYPNLKPIERLGSVVLYRSK